MVEISLGLLLVIAPISGLAGWSAYRRSGTARSPLPLLICLAAVFLVFQIVLLSSRIALMAIILPDGNGGCFQMSLPFVFNQIFCFALFPGVITYMVLGQARFRWFSLFFGGAACLFSIALPVYAHVSASRLGDERSPDGVILQTSGYSCSAATCANILNYYGQPTTEKEMAVRLGLTRFGASDEQVMYVLRSAGIDCERKQTTKAQLSEATSPAILSIDHPATGPETHLVLFMSCRDGVYEVWNPLAGKEFYSGEMLGRVWHGKTIFVRGRDDATKRTDVDLPDG